MGKILLSIDDLEDSTTPEYGFLIARKCAMELEILFVEEQRELRDDEMAQLHQILERAKKEGLTATLSVVRGRPAKEIVRKAANLALVVLHHRHQVEDLGSGLLRDIQDEPDGLSPLIKDVLRQAAVPSLVTFGMRSAMRRPLIAFNGSRKSERILKAGLQLMGQRVFRRGIALYVGPESPEAREILRRARTIAREHHVDLETRLIDGDPGAVIVDQAEANGCDLIVMGAYIRGLLSRALTTSATESVLSRSLQPILLG
ncbi:MAG: universal stress protein [Myxococcales bacterium]|nr:universal stress protein [Myxococcales bacterium]